MTELQPKTQSQGYAGVSPVAATPNLVIKDSKRARNMLIGLMVPMLMMTFNMGMFGVALPTIRDQFGIQADTTSWLITAYTLPFVVAMPLYGRLGDGLGKRRLFLFGIAIFMAGTGVILLAPSLALVILGRAVQGIGASGVTPLCMSIISERFPAGERGKALGTWNSMGPIGAFIGPLLGGFIVVNWGWRMIFVPVLIIGMVALFAISRQVPPTGSSFVKPGFLRKFDWGGVIFLGLATVAIVFYLSSRPITGVEPLLDWRLLIAAVFSLGVFVVWEKRQVDPFVDLKIFDQVNFVRASVGAGIRMFVMGGLGFLMPLYVTDIYGLNAAGVGVVTMAHALALLIPMRFGGQLADRWNSRGPVLIGVSVQLLSLIYLTQLSPAAPVWMAVLGLVIHGLGAGLYLAPLHRTVLDKIPADRTGIVAGLYGMIRFGGMVLGAVIAGVVLQYGLDQGWPVIEAYQLVFWFVAGVTVIGLMVGWGLKD
jgi:EmrB/QacA subfamily drug resistance transporter